MTNYPLQWFIDRIGKTVYRDKIFPNEDNPQPAFIENELAAQSLYELERFYYWGISYRDNP